jgi:hypothetical protein
MDYCSDSRFASGKERHINKTFPVRQVLADGDTCPLDRQVLARYDFRSLSDRSNPVEASHVTGHSSMHESNVRTVTDLVPCCLRSSCKLNNPIPSKSVSLFAERLFSQRGLNRIARDGFIKKGPDQIIMDSLSVGLGRFV